MKALLAGLLAFAWVNAASEAAPAGEAGKFDYYMLALSWSPSFCASPGAARREPLQCARARGFIVHGLWPELTRGWPSHCVSSLARDVPLDLQRRQLDLTPSAGLIVHEWQTHGLCTGLSQTAYFNEARALRARIRTPNALASPTQAQTTTPALLRAAFIQMNPALRREDMTVTCNKSRLEDVRFCFTKAGAFRACAETKDQCLPGKIAVPASGAK